MLFIFFILKWLCCCTALKSLYKVFLSIKWGGPLRDRPFVSRTRWGPSFQCCGELGSSALRREEEVLFLAWWQLSQSPVEVESLCHARLTFLTQKVLKTGIRECGGFAISGEILVSNLWNLGNWGVWAGWRERKISWLGRIRRVIRGNQAWESAFGG